MAIVLYKRPRVNLYSKNNAHIDLTGGWKISSANTNNFKFQIPFEDKAYFNDSLFITERSENNAVMLMTSDDNQGVTSASIITNKLIDFSKHKSLNFIFNRDNDFIASGVFKRDLKVELLDNFKNVLKSWNCGEKTCWYERGRIEYDSISTAYIQITFNMSRSFDLLALLDKNLNQLYTVNDEKIILKQYVKPSPSDPTYTTGNMLFEIMDMWLE